MNTPIDAAEMISGERIQQLTDVSVLTDPILRFHKNLPRLPIRWCRFSGDMRSFAVDDAGQIAAVASAEIIFVYTHLVASFAAQILPRLDRPFILVTHNSDDAVDARFTDLLGDDRLFTWFAQNVAVDHPKLVSLPLGVANSQWPHGRPDLINKVAVRGAPKTGFVYMNFDARTNPKRRRPVFERLSDHPLVTVSGGLGYEDYLGELAAHHFCVCPPGNGLDCHRIWECLYLGVVPLVSADARLRGFDELPIVTVDDWDRLDAGFLQDAYQELARRRTGQAKMRLSYWQSAIDVARHRLRQASGRSRLPAALAPAGGGRGR
ncbi:MAG: hypothetical protein ABIL58_29075 [Pseudomonadota bacterium]